MSDGPILGRGALAGLLWLVPFLPPRAICEEAVREALPPVLTLVAGVKDPVFAVLVGLLDSNAYGALTRERLETELGPRAGRSRLPYRRLHELTRLAVLPGRSARVTLRFDGPFDQPIPYSILGYHPGRIAASQTCVFREWIMGGLGGFDDVHLFALIEGRLFVDIDGWLDFLMGSALDDTEVEGLVVLRRQGRWLGMAVGHNRKRGGRSGSFDFAADRIVFPSPSDMKALAREMRVRIETLAAAEPPVLTKRAPAR